MPMEVDKTALLKCRDRMEKSRRSLYEMRNSKDFQQFYSAWAEFLIHSGGVMNAIQSATGASPQGRQWYGRLKREAKGDPLLTYMVQARNVEEHAPSMSAEEHPGSIAAGINEDVVINMTIDPAFYRNPVAALQKGVRRIADGKAATIQVTPRGPVLVPVTDSRHGNTFPVPSQHLGRPLERDDPIFIAEAYMSYLEGALRQVEELA